MDLASLLHDASKFHVDETGRPHSSQLADEEQPPRGVAVAHAHSDRPRVPEPAAASQAHPATRRL